MYISPVSNMSYMEGTGTNNNNEIKVLEKQKEMLQDQLEKTKESKMDAKIKQDLIKQLEEQIRQIETQIQQKRNEKLSDSINHDSNEPEKSSRSGSAVNSPGSGDDLSSLSDLVAASASYSRAAVMNNIKSDMEGKGNVLNQEIEMDESRGVDPKAKKAELEKMKEHAKEIDQKVGDTLQSAEKSATEANADDVKSGEDVGDPGETDQQADPQNDSLSWLLENGEKYKSVDALA